MTNAAIRIDNVRFAFPHLFTPKESTDGAGKPKFSVSAIFPQDHPQVGAIKSAILAAATAKWGEKAADVLKSLSAGDRVCMKDGDAKSQYTGFAGNLFVNSSNEARPLVLGPAKEILAATDGKPYAGSYGNVAVEFWAQDNKFGKRINARLKGVQFVKDGERLSGGGIARADEFDAIPVASMEKAESSGQGASALFS